MVGEPGNKGRTGTDCLMAILKEKPGLKTMEGLEFHHCPGFARERRMHRWEWAVTSAAWLPPSLSSCTAKGAWKTVITPPSREEPNFPMERNVVKLSSEGEATDISD